MRPSFPGFSFKVLFRTINNKFRILLISREKKTSNYFSFIFSNQTGPWSFAVEIDTVNDQSSDSINQDEKVRLLYYEQHNALCVTT